MASTASATEAVRPSPQALAEGLARLGYAGFRPGQREAIETLFDARRLLLVAPTGGGKSLTYQLPASLLPGTSLVISPLVALMHDQVEALGARGVPATFLASTLTSEEMRSRLSWLRSGACKLAYVAPERLAYPGFRALLHELRTPLVAVDEAHCISEWGHDFRPDYLGIGALLAEVRPALVLACTATATPVVRDEILARLGLPADTPQVLRGFARPNLALQARESLPRDRGRHVDALLAEALGAPGAGRGTAIVYSPTRKLAEEEAQRLAASGWRAAAYHAGMDGSARTSTQRAFAEGAVEVVAATNAFGMGIDRADVRAVVHLAPPGSIEAYYQEVGRAGRDGAPAFGLLLHSPSDLPLRRRLIDGAAAENPAAAATAEHKWNLFLELMRFIEGGSCRHDAILRYFGDEAETLSGCGRCDVCQGLQDDGPSDETETTMVVRKALSAVARVHRRFGLTAAVKLLAGAQDPRLVRAGLHESPTFGVLAEHPEDWLTRLLRRCVSAGFVELSPGDRPVALLTASGRAVMKGERPPRLALPRVQGPGLVSRPPARAGAAPPADTVLSADERGLFESLRRLRLELAREEDVPPYVVASDRALRDLVRLRPRTKTALLQAYGIGPAKVEKYGDRLLEALA